MCAGVSNGQGNQRSTLNIIGRCKRRCHRAGVAPHDVARAAFVHRPIIENEGGRLGGRLPSGLPVMVAMAETRAEAEADHRRGVVPWRVVAIGAVVRPVPMVPMAVVPVPMLPVTAMARAHVDGLTSVSSDPGLNRAVGLR